MIFTVTRTSGGKEKPCDEARNFTEKYKDYEPNDYDVVEFKSLEELAKFIDKYGRIVIDESNCHKYPLDIEIYDDYRE